MIIYLHYANVYIHGLEIHLTLMNGFKFNKIKIMHLCRYMYVVSKLIVLRQFFLLISKKSGRVFYSLQVLKVHSINCIKSMKTTQYFFFWMSFFIRLQYTAKKKKINICKRHKSTINNNKKKLCKLFRVNFKRN